MKTFILEGAPNSGKTTALAKLREKLEKKPIYEEQLGDNPKDKLTITKINGKNLGICSLGDYPYLIPFYAGFLIAKECDLIILANSNKLIPGYVLEKLGKCEIVEKKEATDFDEKRVVELLFNQIIQV